MKEKLRETSDLMTSYYTIIESTKRQPETAKHEEDQEVLKIQSTILLPSETVQGPDQI